MRKGIITKVQSSGAEQRGCQLPLSGQQGWDNSSFREVHKQISPPTNASKKTTACQSPQAAHNFHLEATAHWVEQGQSQV